MDSGIKALANYAELPGSDALISGNFILAPGGSNVPNGATLGVLSAGYTKSYNNDYFYMATGTSQATPHVTGVVALALQANPKLTAAEVRDIILTNSDTVDGYRALNAEKAVRAALATLSKPTATITIITPSPQANSGVIFQPNITASPNGAVTEFEWDFGDGTITMGTPSQITHTYTSAGTYTVKLKIKDVKGVTNTTTTTITVTGISSQSALSALQAGAYAYSNDMQCYYKTILGSSVGANEYATSDTKYCLNSAKNAWVQTVDDAGLLLLPNGTWVSGNNPNILFTGANSFTNKFGDYAFQSGSFTQNTVGSNYPGGSTSGTVSVTDTRDRYILFSLTNNSYVYDNTTDLDSLIATWNASFNGQATLTHATKYGWSFVTPSVTDYTAGIYRVYDVSLPPTCTGPGTGPMDTCQRPVVSSGAWAKEILSDGSPSIRINIYSPYTTVGEQPLYVKRASDSGVRQGVRQLSGGTRSFNSANRTYMNADLAARGYPTTVN
jgi:PKD repeat protein